MNSHIHNTMLSEAVPLLSINGLTFCRDNKTILSDINLTVNRGDFMAVTGPNGGGKTTLLRLILGLLAPTSGNIIYYDTEGRPASTRPVFGYLPQKNSVDAHFPITVAEVVASGLLGVRNLDKASKGARIEATLERIGLADLADRPIGRLSGGQLQRALFGRAIIAEAPVLVLDEPLSYIDKHFEERLYGIVDDISRQATVILVSHEMSAIGAMANRHIKVDHTLCECTAAHHYTAPQC